MLRMRADDPLGLCMQVLTTTPPLQAYKCSPRRPSPHREAGSPTCLPASISKHASAHHDALLLSPQGGWVAHGRVLHILAVARSLGDRDFKYEASLAAGMPITADLVSASPEVRSKQLKCLPASLPPSPSMHVLTTAPSPPHRYASAVCSRATSSSSRAMGSGMSSRARRPLSTCIRTGPPKAHSERSRCSCRRPTSSSTRLITSPPATCDSAPRSDEARRRRSPSPRPTQPTGCGRAPNSRQ